MPQGFLGRSVQVLLHLSQGTIKVPPNRVLSKGAERVVNGMPRGD